MDRMAMVKLISQTYAGGGIAEQEPQETEREIFCQVGSVSGEEIAQAGLSGLQARLKIAVFEPEYEGEEIAELDGVRYGIYRSYLTRGERLELYLERKAGV